MSDVPIETITSKCGACGAEMPTNVRYCGHCNSWQDWRGHIHLSSTVLSLLIALISVTSIAVPWLKDSLRQDGSYIRATVVRTGDLAGQPFDVQVLVANTGNRPGTLGNFYFRKKGDAAWQTMDIPGYWMPPKSIEIVQPGSSGFVYLSRMKDTGEIEVAKSLPKEFEVKLEVIEFDTSRRELVLSFASHK